MLGIAISIGKRSTIGLPFGNGIDVGVDDHDDDHDEFDDVAVDVDVDRDVAVAVAVVVVYEEKSSLQSTTMTMLTLSFGNPFLTFAISSPVFTTVATTVSS